MVQGRYVFPFSQLRMTDVDRVGGKNASLGELLSQLTSAGIRVPDGFATTAEAFRLFLKEGGLEERIAKRLESLDVDDVKALAEAGAEIRGWIESAPFPAELEKEIREFYEWLKDGQDEISVAVRSSATAEDLPDASFAGQQETVLNVVGIDAVFKHMKEVFASLYNDRAISYRVHKGFTHAEVALSAGVQRMCRSDRGAAGVMFTIDTESGFDQVVFITASYGLGETVVQGAVNPDEFYVHKPILDAGKYPIIRKTLGSKLIKMEFESDKSAGRTVRTVDVAPEDRRQFAITDEDVIELARFARIIEKHYGRPMDIEWGKDGNDGKIYILQARPETVKSQQSKSDVQLRYSLKTKGRLLCQGRAIGQKIGLGPVRIVESAAEMDRVQAGDVLVTDMTDPNWEPVMKKASAIVTNRGGRTCHAAIIARELGIPAVVGCGDATERLAEGDEVTVSCAEGDTGNIYEGLQEVAVEEVQRGALPEIPVKIMMNVGNPQLAFEFQSIPNKGVGLARLEFIINNIGIHPKVVLEYPNVPSELRDAAERLSAGYASPKEFFEKRIAEGVATIAAAFYPKKVIVRMSDFKSNEYRKLIGGALYEPDEENPMLGFRGASRYISNQFAECFAMECRAMKFVRDEMGLTNVELMIPFVRTLNEAKRVTEIMESHGLKRGVNGLRLNMMCEIPSNAVLADQFLDYFDGFSIGSNDMTQLALGLDRDSGLVAASFDERDPAVKGLLSMAIKACVARGKYVGICGQGPSDHADFAAWLMEQGIESISLNPDTVVDTWRRLAK